MSMNRLLAGLAPRQLLPTTSHVTSAATECMSLASGMEFCTEFDMIETAIEKKDGANKGIIHYYCHILYKS